MMWRRHPEDERLLAFLTGNLDDLAQDRVERHLSNCARCRRECAEFDNALRVWEARRLEAPGELLAAVRAAIGEARPAAASAARKDHLAAVVGRRLISQSDGNELGVVLESFLGRHCVAAFRDGLNPEPPR